jgi:HEAT repeat protein
MRILVLPALALSVSAGAETGIGELLTPILAEPADLERRVELVREPLQPEEVLDAMRRPDEALNESVKTGARLTRLPAEALLREAAKRLGWKLRSGKSAKAAELPEGVPAALAKTVGALASGASRAEPDLEIADFFGRAVTNATADPKRLERGETWLERDLSVLERARAVDVEGLLQGGDDLLRAAAAALPALVALSTDAWPAEISTYTVDGVSVRIGTLGDDRHADGFDLLVDPGGDDEYRLGVRPGSSTVILDLSGDDRYVSKGYGGPASALFAASVLVDVEGDDLYIGEDGAQASALFGTAVLWDMSGSDLYTARAFSQGAASFGAALLLDEAGTDLYRASYLSQGMGYVRGVGLLRDGSGNDLYTAGFSEPDPRGYYEKYGGKKQGEVFQSLSQGFGMGWRGYAGGGFGYLLDARGNDRYAADYFGQGAAYWFGRGLLFDGSGNDSYVARRYAQGSGIHFAVGELVDLDGNDRYQTWAVGLGTGHDYGVGSLFDASGEDVYVGDWSVLGMSNAQGVGLFRDQGGHDRYVHLAGAAAVSYWDDLRHGAGIGVFADTGDMRDRFAVDASTRIWSSSPWSASLSGKLDSKWRIPVPESFDRDDGKGAYQAADEKEGRFLRARLEHAAGLGDRTRISELFFVAAGWGIQTAVPSEAKRALLLEPPDRALPVLLSLLNPRNIFATFMLEEYFHSAPGAIPGLKGLISSDDPKIRAAAAFYLGKLRDPGSVAILTARLKDRDWLVRKAACRALGHIYDRKVRDRLEDLRTALKGKNRKEAVAWLREHKKTDLLWLVAKSGELKRRDWARLADGWERWAPSEAVAEAAAEILIRDGVFPLDLETEARFQRSGVLSGLERSAQDPHPEVRRWAVWALHQHRADPGLIAGSLYDPDHGVREAAAKALSERGSESIEALKRGLKKARGRARAQIVRALAGVEDAALERTFESETKNEDSRVRFEALKALEAGRRKGRWSVSELVLRRLEKDADRWVKSLAIRIRSEGR